MKVDLANLELVTVNGEIAILVRLGAALGDELPALETARRKYTLTLPDEDPLRQFLRDCVRASIKGRTRATKLFEAYLAWSQLTGAEPVGRVRFSRAMRAIGYRRLHSNGSYWLGMTLLSEDPPAASDDGQADLGL